MRFGNRLKQLRQENRLTQAQLGSLFNLAESTISLYESNKRTPDYITLIKLSNFFHVSADYLLGSSEERLSKEQEPIVSSFSADDPSQLYQLFKYPLLDNIKWSSQGIVYEYSEAKELFPSKNNEDPTKYYWIKIKDAALEGEHILCGDLALVKEDAEAKEGELQAVSLKDAGLTICHVYQKKNARILQFANSNYPPLIFTGKEIDKVIVLGKVIQLFRMF